MQKIKTNEMKYLDERRVRVLNENKKNSKTIDIVHVIYLSIIFTGIIIWLVSYIFGKSTYAGSLLSFGGTLSSILLAVIAIIITLIDVAGQRSNILDVKNSVEDLTKVSNEITIIVDEFEKSNTLRQDNMLTTITQFNNNIEANSKKFDDINAKLGKISLTGESQEELEKIKGDINEMKDSLKKPFIDPIYSNSSKIVNTKDLFDYNNFKSNMIYVDRKTGKVTYQTKDSKKE